MATTNLGRVRFNMRGDYNPAADPLYSLLDLVSDGGGSFVYINDTPSNEPTSSTSHWQQIATGGAKGDTGAKIVSAAWSGNDMLLTLDDESTITLTGAKTTLKGDPGDISNIKVDGATKTKAAGVVDMTSDFARYAIWRKTASGNPVSVYPVPESPLYPKVSGTSTQAGTGDSSPENIRPITPWLASGAQVKVKRTGKNLIPMFVGSTKAGMSLTVDADGTCHLTGTTSAAVYWDATLNVLPGTISLSLNNPVLVANGNFFAGLRNSVPEYIIYKSFEQINSKNEGVIPTTVGTVFRLFIPSGVTLSNFIFRPQLELGSTATAYEPYTESEITLTAPQEIASGWMDNEGAGQVTWRRRVFDGTEAWGAWDTNGIEKRMVINDALHTPSGSGSLAISAFSSHYKVTSANLNFSRTSGVSGDGTRLYVYDPAYVTTDVSAWKAYLAAQYASGTPVTVCYQLATPVSITPATAPLTALPQLDRVTPRSNVLTASTGNIELTYAKSPIREADDIATAIAAL